MFCSSRVARPAIAGTSISHIKARETLGKLLDIVVKDGG